MPNYPMLPMCMCSTFHHHRFQYTPPQNLDFYSKGKQLKRKSFLCDNKVVQRVFLGEMLQRNTHGIIFFLCNSLSSYSVNSNTILFVFSSLCCRGSSGNHLPCQHWQGWKYFFLTGSGTAAVDLSPRFFTGALLNGVLWKFSRHFLWPGIFIIH